MQQQGGAVDLVLGECEPVSGRRAYEDVGVQLRPRPGHEDLHRLSRPLRQLVRPQPCHQPFGAAACAQVAREQREETAEPGRGDLLSAIGDTRQQGQVGGHPYRLAMAWPPELPSRAELPLRGRLPQPVIGQVEQALRPPFVLLPQHGGPGPGGFRFGVRSGHAVRDAALDTVNGLGVPQVHRVPVRGDDPAPARGAVWAGTTIRSRPVGPCTPAGRVVGRQVWRPVRSNPCCKKTVRPWVMAREQACTRRAMCGASRVSHCSGVANCHAVSSSGSR